MPGTSGFPKFPEDAHQQYHQLHSGAHRKIATRVGVPSFVRHLAYWQPENEKREQWIDEIDHRLCKLYHRLRLNSEGYVTQLKLNTGSGDHISLFNGRYCKEDTECKKDTTQAGPYSVPDERRVVRFKFRWHFIPVAIRCELHSEYFSITYIIDASRVLHDAKECEKAKIEPMFKFVNDTFDSLSIFLMHGFNEQSAAVREGLYRDLYENIPEKFFDEVMSPPSERTIEDRKKVGSIFADFCIVLIGDRPETGADGINRFSRRPFSQSRDEGRPMGPDHPSPDVNWASDKVKVLLPFIAPRGEPFSMYDVTASRMLDGRTIYASALAPQPDEKCVSLHAIHYSSSLDRRQIGRLVDRLNHLGDLRLAAIIDAESFRKISNSISEIEDGMQGASDLIHAQNLSAAAEKLRDIYNRMGKIGKSIDGGFTNRVERSRYYVKQWRDGVGDLRIKRIEGFQPYDLFIERRLGATFEYVDRVGARFERVQKDIAQLEQYYLTQGNLKVNEGIEEFQKWGEIALLMFLVPYYAGHLFYEISKSSGERSEASERGAWALIWCLGVGFAVIRLSFPTSKNWFNGKDGIVWRIFKLLLRVIFSVFVAIVAISLGAALLVFLMKTLRPFLDGVLSDLLSFL